MSSEESKAVTQRFVDLFNAGDITGIRDLFAPDAVAHQPGVPVPLDVDGLEKVGEAFAGTFPDGKIEVVDLFANGDRAVVHWVLRGTHTGDAMGIPPTGNKVSLRGMEINHLKDGKIVEHWVVFDQLDLMQQLGVMPAPEAAGA